MSSNDDDDDRLAQLSGGGILELPEEDPTEFTADLVDPEQVPPAVWPSLSTNWSYVRTHFHLGSRYQDVYVFRLHSLILSNVEVSENAQIALLRQSTQFRFNVSFAFVLVRKSTEASPTPEMRIFYASNNSGLYKIMPWCSSHADAKHFIKELAAKDIYEDLSRRLPNTAWKIHSIISMTVYIAKMTERLY